MKKIFAVFFNTQDNGEGSKFVQNLENKRRIQLLKLVILLGISALFILTPLAFYQQDLVLGFIDLGLLSIFVILLAAMRKKNRFKAVAFCGVTLTGFFMLLLTAYGGIANTAHLWSFAFPMLAIFLLGTRPGVVFSLGFIAADLLIFAFGPVVDFMASYSAHFVVRFFFTYLTIFMFTLIMESLCQHTQQELSRMNRSQEKLISKMAEKIDEIRTLQGILPICANCKKIRNDNGYWEQVEKYIQHHSDAQFSHSICPDCRKELYPDID